MIQRWLRDRAVRRAREDADRGYDYAAGQLLRGTAPASLMNQMAADPMFTHFDLGMSFALDAWAKMLQLGTTNDAPGGS